MTISFTTLGIPRLTPVKASTVESSICLLVELLAESVELNRGPSVLMAAVKCSEEILLVIARGIDYIEYLRFETVTPHAYWTMGSAE